jgi:hypothetical protein
MTDDFYVGYQPRAPRELARFIAAAATTIVIGVLAAGALLIFKQPRFAASRFEFGVGREYLGSLEPWPYPTLITSNARYLLVAPGKHGLQIPDSLRSKRVRLRGTLIERGSERMLEVLPTSIHEEPSSPREPQSSAVDLGPIRLVGEIVDSKCYFGVMNPGEGKVHRDCAARCISGGSPPAFIVRGSSDEIRTLLLTDAKGHPLNREILPFVAEPVAISGELVRSGSTLILEADPSHIERE